MASASFTVTGGTPSAVTANGTLKDGTYQIVANPNENGSFDMACLTPYGNFEEPSMQQSVPGNMGA